MTEMRICVHADAPTMLPANVDRINMTMWDTVNVLRNIVHFIRNQYNGIPQKRARIEDVHIWTDEVTDDPRVCIVWHPETKQIKISIIGMTEWQAEIACDLAANQIERDLITPVKESWLNRLRQIIR